MLKDKLLERILSSGEKMALVTIIETRGSAPRHTGSKMLVGSAGILEGTVGGGRGEYNGMLAAQGQLESGGFSILDIARLGDDPKEPLMICGGVNKLLVQVLEGEVLDCWKKAAERVAQGHGAKVRTDLISGKVTLVPLQEPPEAGCFDDLLTPDKNLLILGGGYVGQAIYELGIYLGFRVTVYDDRLEFASRERFPRAEAVAGGEYDVLIDSYPFDDYTHTAIVTRGHLEDAQCLRKVLAKPGKYVGLIGSMRKVRLIMEDLLKDGYDPEELKKVHAPIGLDIGAETPEEIAIAIMAEIIEENNGKKGAKAPSE